MPEDKALHFFRVKRGRTLRDPRTGATLGTPGQVVPKEHRDLDPDSCLGPVEAHVSDDVEEAELAEEEDSGFNSSVGSLHLVEDDEPDDYGFEG